MATHLVLDNTLGATLVALVVAATLHGVAILQTFYYYTHQTDGWHLKWLVGVVVACDLMHQVLITHTVYLLTVTNWGNPAELQLLLWSDVVDSIFVGILTFLVQSFLALRVWHLSNYNKPLVGIIALLILAQFVVNNVAIGLTINMKTWSQVLPLSWLSMLSNVLTVAGDVLIAASLCTLLHRMRTGARRSNSMINTLIVFTVNAGSITSIFAIASLLSLIFAGHTLLNMSFYWCLGRLYTNCLLATLNFRKKIGAMVMNGDNLSFSLRDLNIFKSASRKTQRSGDLSIKIDTAIAFARDEQLDRSGALFEKDQSKDILTMDRTGDLSKMEAGSSAEVSQ